jgi:hypothetical protein
MPRNPVQLCFTYVWPACVWRKKMVIGYIVVRMPGHPRANACGWVLEQVVVAEVCVGGPLAHVAVVHHRDRDRSNNHPSNLVVFADNAAHTRYHAYIRRRDLDQLAFWPELDPEIAFGGRPLI